MDRRARRLLGGIGVDLDVRQSMSRLSTAQEQMVQIASAVGTGARILVFAGVMTGSEWLRGHLFTGFPWDLPGESWRAGSPPSQVAALIGAYGLSWITVAIAAT